MKPKSCFLIGHRETLPEILPVLADAIEQHITDFGVGEFIVGNHGGFDRLAVAALSQAKLRHPEITLTLLLAYHPAERPVEKPESFDGTYYPPGMECVPRRFAIVKANRQIAANVDYLIAYVWHPASSSREILEYAQRLAVKGKPHITVLKKERRT